MKLTNDCYVISLHTKRTTECYFRDNDGWLKVSARGRTYRATAEQVLNHILPALARIKPNITVQVEYDPAQANGARTLACFQIPAARLSG